MLYKKNYAPCTGEKLLILRYKSEPNMRLVTKHSMSSYKGIFIEYWRNILVFTVLMLNLHSFYI